MAQTVNYNFLHDVADDVIKFVRTKPKGTIVTIQQVLNDPVLWAKYNQFELEEAFKYLILLGFDKGD